MGNADVAHAEEDIAWVDEGFSAQGAACESVSGPEQELPTLLNSAGANWQLAWSGAGS